MNGPKDNKAADAARSHDANANGRAPIGSGAAGPRPGTVKDDFVGYGMSDVARLLRTVFERRVRDLGLTRSQWMVITRIRSNPGLSQSEVADILEIEKASAGRLIDRMEAIVKGQALSYGVEAELVYEIGYPATINTPDRAAFAAGIAAEVAGADHVVPDAGREMGAEDFSYMLQARPGAYLFLGQGDSAGLHHPEYDFNDAVAPVGASFFARLVERAQPVAG